MTYEHILVKHDGAITDITMNRPERRNALSEAHMTELVDAFRAAGARRETRAVILSGNGPAFCAGHDLREMLDRDVANLSPSLRALRRADDRNPGNPSAGDRAGARHRHCRRVPARRHLRSRRRRRRRPLCDPRSEHRPLLHHADGRADARDRPQARHADAADRRRDRRADRRRVGSGQPRRPRRRARRRGARPGGGDRRRPARSPSPSASRRSTPRSTSTSPRRTPTRRK